MLIDLVVDSFQAVMSACEFIFAGVTHVSPITSIKDTQGMQTYKVI
jgi:hypothetical protein